MSYDILLFDADATLFDYDKAEETALVQMFQAYNLNYSEDVRTKYREINKGLWDQYEKREISKQYLQVHRFAKLFNEIGLDSDPKLFNEQYLAALGNGAQLIDGAYEICKTLFEHEKSIYIVTNGVSTTQKMRINNSVIKNYIAELFVSEDIGFQKPQKQFFDYVFLRIKAYDKTNVLIVGDSLTADIQGGHNAGIDTCWFNPSQKENATEIIPTYEITELSQMKSICAM